MAQSIFSQYKGGENRVTSTIIQVLKNLPVNVVEYFLASFSGGDAGTFIQFKNQVKGGGSIPDAEISANFKLYFETKTNENSINSSQLEKHLVFAKKAGALLVYLTPDNSMPKELIGKNIVWKSFQDLHDLISELLADRSLILSERDQFLFRNLQDFIEESGLLPPIDQVVIVAANSAWDIYQKYGLYICQPNRSFRNAKYMGFYANGKIQPTIAKIIDIEPKIDFKEMDSKDIESIFDGKLMKWLNDDRSSRQEACNQIVNLSPYDSQDPKPLDHSIVNNLKNDNGRGYAFTQYQRYVPLESLRSAKWTSDLINK